MSTQGISLPVVTRTAAPQAPTAGPGTITLPAIAATAASLAPTVAAAAVVIALPVIARKATVRRGPRVRRSS